MSCIFLLGVVPSLIHYRLSESSISVNVRVKVLNRDDQSLEKEWSVVTGNGLWDIP